MTQHTANFSENGLSEINLFSIIFGTIIRNSFTSYSTYLNLNERRTENVMSTYRSTPFNFWNLAAGLTFIGPLSSSIFAEYNQQDATFHNLFISLRRSTCFRRFFSPSSGAQTAHTASGICQTNIATCC